MNKENYFKNHPSYKYDESLTYRESFLDKYYYDLKEYVSYIKDWNILEIGTWIWNFTYFCNKIWVSNYTGIDIDDYFFKYHIKDFSNYRFIKSRFQDYLDENKKFDIIFTSHVFEHLDEKERVEMINYIHNSLNNWWIWINYMPNADSSLLVWFWRWWDITHKTIYNKTAFLQLVSQSWKSFSNILHFNTFIWYNFIKRWIHKIFLSITKIYYLWMGRVFPEIYTWEIISILKK